MEKKPETRRLQPPKSFGDVLKRGCRQFTSDELAGFGVRDLDFDCHIFLGNKYLVPVPSDTRITHVTKGSLDGWTVQSAQWMASRGNKISNEYYLANRNADTSPVPSRLTTPEGLFPSLRRNMNGRRGRARCGPRLWMVTTKHWPVPRSRARHRSLLCVRLEKP